MNKLSRLTALLLALIMLLGNVSTAESGLPIGGASGLTSDDWANLVDDAESKLFFTDEGDTGGEMIPETPEQPEKPESYPYTRVEEIALIQSGEAVQAAITASEAVILTHEAAGQWQIYVDGVWAILPGETGDTLIVNRAMMNGQSSTEVRKALGKKNAETGEYTAYTQTAVINIIEAAPAMFSVGRDVEDMAASDANQGIMTLEVANQENMVIVQVVYRIRNTNQPVADPYVGQIAKGSALNTRLVLPRVTGYAAGAITGKVGLTDLTAEELQAYAVFTQPSEDDPGSLALTVTKALSEEDITIYVEYEPAEVNYTVRHMHQDKVGDGYTLYEEEMLSGMTGSAVGADLQETYEGFSYIWYDPTTSIAADGSTVVEIRYNREYYQMTFDLRGGYGVEPIFVRYGADVNVIDPTRDGYKFEGWASTKELAETGIADVQELPETMPAEKTKYYAVWTATTTSFTVVYWLENPNDDGYSYWDSYAVEEVQTGTEVQAVNYEYYPTDKTDNRTTREKQYSVFNEETTRKKNGDEEDGVVTVAGDGTTVINVYFDRKVYTLKFYYAMHDAVNGYRVVGGSTYYFGKHDSSSSYRTDEKTLFSYYIKKPGGLLGRTEEPTLNERGKARKYTKAKDAYTFEGKEYEFHYISFDAKYGADISGLWPCNVFNPVIAYDREWDKSNKAHVSAWNGEYNVWYTQNKSGNQTIKGNYDQLDYKILWANGDPEDMTVTYLCFWENGAEAGWNIPELYRYKIWAPVIDGVIPEGKEWKTHTDRITYYLYDVYDTVDDSNVDSQTDPAITGLQFKERVGVKLEEYVTATFVAEHIQGNCNCGEAHQDEVPSGTYETVRRINKHLFSWDDEGNVIEQLYNEAYEVNFYYSRNTYDLTFKNYNEMLTDKAKKVPFGRSLADMSFLPEYPEGMEAGSREFAGWYTTERALEETKFDFNTTMPANNIALYANWQLRRYNVQFWIDKDSVGSADAADKVVNYPDITHGMTVVQANEEGNYIDLDEWLKEHPEHAYSKYDFDGWYYMDGETEKRFDIETMPVKSAMDIYAKWTSNTPVPFVFHYVHEISGEKIAESFVGEALPGTLVTKNAKIGAELDLIEDEEQALRYIPRVSSHSLTLDVNPDKNVFTFLYALPNTINYTVQYLAAKEQTIDGKTVLVPERKDGELIHLIDPITQPTTKAVVTENYVPIAGRMPQATQLRLIVSMDETANVIQFLYLPNEREEYVNATHYTIDHEYNVTIQGTDQNIRGTINSKEGVYKRDYTGYVFSHAVVDETRLINDELVVTRDVPAEETEGDKVLHPLPNGGMHIHLYYKPVDCHYIVHRLNDADKLPILEPKEGVAPYGSTLLTSQFADPIEDYRVVSMTPAEVRLDVEDPDALVNNVMYIYYELDVTDITISKNIAYSTDADAQQPTPEQLNTDFTFNVKLSHESKEKQENSYVTIDGVRQAMEVKNGVLTFTLKNGQSATIHDLWGGTEYVVTEADQKDFKTSYDTFHKGVLSSMNVNTVVTNTFPKHVGELTVIKQGMKDGKESAIVRAEVGDDVYYLVLNGSNNYTATISGIKPDTNYKVTELDHWSWQYSSGIRGGSNGDGTGKITETDKAATVIITNTYDGDKWLHDESHVINDFGTGTKDADYNN